MDFKRVLKLHYVNHMSSRSIAESCGDCSKTSVNDFIKRFKACKDLYYPLPYNLTNEEIATILYKKSGPSKELSLYRQWSKYYHLILLKIA